MRSEYEKIYAKLKEQAPHRNYEWFQAYGKPGMKNGLMVVGRAVNGWRSFTANDEFDKLYREIPEPLEDGNEGDVASYFSGGYNINTSAFWRTVRNVAKGLYPCNDRNFGKNMIYSNLYKIAFPGANPDYALQRLQLPECINILKKEIQYWEPSAVLFLTDWNWAEPFLTSPELNFVSDENTFEQLKTCGTLLTKNCRAAVIPHPQGKKERLLAGQAIAFFQNFNSLYEEISSISGGLERKWQFNDRSEEIYFTTSPVWENSGVPLLLQTDLNLLCFRVGIWSRDKKFIPLSQYLSQKLGLNFRCNSAWCGGYTEVKFCDANDSDIGLADLVKKIYGALK